VPKIGSAFVGALRTLTFVSYYVISHPDSVLLLVAEDAAQPAFFQTLSTSVTN
jgi:hypothetical protein